MAEFINIFFHYLWEVLPWLLVGFLLSALINEFVPTDWVIRNLGGGGLKPIFSATFVGIFLPVCCFGSLPLGITFYRKGAGLGPVLAFLAATPATSISALLVTYRLLGLGFTLYLFFSVVLIGLVLGIFGNKIRTLPRIQEENPCPHCAVISPSELNKKGIENRLLSILKFAFLEMPREIGKETLLGILLAAIIATFAPIGVFVKSYLTGLNAYLFALIFGVLMYICSTGSVPLVHALTFRGMESGAGMALLILGPITAWGALLVIRKEFGTKVLLFYLIVISLLSLTLGYLFSQIFG